MKIVQLLEAKDVHCHVTSKNWSGTTSMSGAERHGSRSKRSAIALFHELHSGFYLYICSVQTTRF